MEMVARTRIEQIVFDVIDDINTQLLDEQHLEKSNETVLMGQTGRLDSLSLVNLIVSVEGAIEDELDVSISLADEKAMSQKNSPFRTVRTLIDYIMVLLQESE